MATNIKNSTSRGKSKRQRRQKIIVYIMIIAMVLSSITAGLAYFINF
ncbi:stressosome-associated protein Prli42 [Oceanobacillus caeni]|nr:MULTISPECIES: stressosome-associated protein Prli42 [Bacillaceae]MCR1834412.1 stressosome-associated protein Prli42 [Oceanobacillus caeni]MED4473395.1 stressosome-associated protein Prli42 [Oceanobacillus caeni]